MNWDPRTHLLLVQAIQRHLAGSTAEARAGYEAVLEAAPRHSTALHLLGVTYLQTGDPEAGLAWIEKALRLDPHHPETLASLGTALKLLGRHGEALAALEKSLALKPDQFDALHSLAETLHAIRRHEEAAAVYRQALARKPDDPILLSNLGLVLEALRLPDEARAAYERALEVRPDFAEAHNNLAVLLQEGNRPEEALPHLEKAIRLKPGYAVAYNNLATLFLDLNRPDEAYEACVTALSLRPGYDEAEWNLGLTHLFRGEFRQGWPLYERRWKRQRADPPPPAPCPLWLGGETIAGKKLLVQAEQGLGDFIQMARYLSVLEGRGAICHVQAPETLHELLRRSFPGTWILSEKEEPGACNYRTPLMSLPLALKTDHEEAIPRAIPYLVPSPEKTDRWRRRLAMGSLSGAARPVRHIGLVWRGNPENGKGLHRFARLADFLPLLSRRDIRCVTLQKDLTAEETTLLGAHPHVVALDAELRSFDDTAAVLAGLDHLITVDTAAVHLAGALGKPASLLLPFGADWRWMIGRGDSPWYPTLRLFRQARAGDWSGPVGEAARALDSDQA